MNWIGESLLDAHQMALPLCVVESLGFKPMLKQCHQTLQLFIASCTGSPFAFCTKVLLAKLLTCLNRVVKIVNFVKTSA